MRTSVTWRILASSAGVFLAAAVALVLTPATVSRTVQGHEIVQLALGVAAFLALHAVLVRRTLRPLGALVADMRRVDVLAPGTRVEVPGGPAEVEALATAFNEMAQRLEQERRTAAGATFSALEDERRRIARDLHDQIGQDLTALLMQLDRMRDHPEAAAARELARDILGEVRGVVSALRPDPLEELGLAEALRSMCSRLDVVGGPAIDCRVEEDLPPLPADGQTAIYRVAQEALTNALRHARATTVSLTLGTEGAQDVVLRVVDDGPPTGRLVEGAGLRGVRERALTVGARVTVGAAAGGGTALELRLAPGVPA
ncbi:HAMP domain-containing protein [Conexibacter sp. W3-3-2]|uniref:sensor histidine kinase n=1 Tax=Conexibacter sp. W3-3-2 TaxID=2675227 RepID=UPI0012BA1378|nr:histidine kinase [Conexibacter sp. W3-3-2]MTD43828.1 HAMP domain-containing protein [Conexibacter sp. W3-3-2]